MKKTKNIDIANGPILKNLLLFAFPVILTALSNRFILMGDNMVVGNFCSNDEYAAVSSNGGVLEIFDNLAVGLSLGASVLVSRYWGARNKEGVKRAVHTVLLTGGIIGLIFGLIMAFGAEFFTSLMKIQSESVFDFAVDYFRIIGFGQIFQIFAMYCSPIIYASGDSKRPSIYAILAGVVNLVLNLVFVLVFKWGVVGVAAATAISQFMTAVLYIYRIFTADEMYRASIKELRIRLRELMQILRLGVPMAIQNVAYGIANTFLLREANGLGPACTSGASASGQIEGFVLLAYSGFNSATTVFTGAAIGAGNPGRVSKILKTILLLSIPFTFGMGVLAIIFSEPLLSIFIPNNPDAMEFGKIKLAIFAGLYFVQIILETISGVVRGLGVSIAPMFISLGGICGVRVMWALLVFPMGAGLDTAAKTWLLYLAYPASWLVTLIGMIICYINVKRKMDAMFKGSDASEEKTEDPATVA